MYYIKKSKERMSHFLSLPANNSNANRYIVSVDLGVENFAYATLDVRNRAIIDWRLLALPHEKEAKEVKSNLFNTKRYTATDINLVHAKWDTLDFGIPRTHKWSADSVMFIVEQQVKQNSRMLKLSDWINEYASIRNFTINMVESSLRFAYMMSRLRSTTIAGYTRAEVKHMACTLVNLQVLDKLDINLQTVYITAHKKDDLADCILQLLASINKRPGWLRQNREVINLANNNNHNHSNHSNHSINKVTISRKPRSKVSNTHINITPGATTTTTTKLRSGPIPRSIVFW